MSPQDLFETLPPWALPLAAIALVVLVAIGWARRRRRFAGAAPGLLGDRARRLRSKRIEATRSQGGRSAGVVGLPPRAGTMAFGAVDGGRSRPVTGRGRDGSVGGSIGGSAASVDPFPATGRTRHPAAPRARDDRGGHFRPGSAHAPTVPLEQRYETDAWVRARVVRHTGRPEYLTLHVAATGVADGKRMLVIDEGDGSGLESIAASDLETVVDLATSRRIDDVWSWLTAGAKPPSVIMVPARHLSSRNER